MAPCPPLSRLLNDCRTDSKCYDGIAQSDMIAKGGIEFVSLGDCLKELFVECMVARSRLVSEQSSVLEDVGGDGIIAPAEAAKCWIRGLFSTPAHLRALDDATLIRYIKVCFVCLISVLVMIGTAPCHFSASCCIASDVANNSVPQTREQR
jgi:hypothetical protein